MPYEKLARLDLSAHDFHFALSLLSRGAAALPKAISLGIPPDFRGAVCPLVHRDRTAFPRILAAASAGRMVGTFALLLQGSGKRQRSPPPPISLDAFRLVVPLVDCRDSWRGRKLEKSDSAARTRIFGGSAAVLDGHRLSAALVYRSAPGLLFHEYVVGVRGLCRDCVEPIIQSMATCRRGTCRINGSCSRVHDAIATLGLAGQTRLRQERRRKLDILGCLGSAAAV